MIDFNKAVDKYTDLILETEKYIWANPETGYKEFKTSAYMEKTFRDLGYDLVMAEGITGFYTVVDTGKPGPEVLVLAELDSIICFDHPDSNPETGAVHSCGHHAQCAALVGFAAALREPGVLDELCGKIRICAVPAEELLEIEYRSKLKAEGKIKYFGGKSEFLSRGYFDGVDIAFMVHASSNFACTNGSVGCITKRIIYKGVAAHAGGAPHLGKNALYAANCGLNAINAIRETFREVDQIRVHPIITDGGSMVNAIPEKVVLESYVRGLTYEAIVQNNQKVNQALTGAALSIGTNVEIIDAPGYSPLVNNKDMIEVAKEGAALAIPHHEFNHRDGYGSGSTDMGDLCCIMPAFHPYSAGSVGTSHGKDYYIEDKIAACVDSAKFQLGMLYILLKDNGKRAKEIITNYKPMFASKEEYLNYVDSLNSCGDRIEYLEDGTVKVNIK
ncbi:MAG: amidohydrolase [Clostridia bacterium]|nr:amidohydrolase [Clostridia bacterium]